MYVMSRMGAAQAGVFPNGGGLDDQPAAFVHALEHLTYLHVKLTTPETPDDKGK